MSGANTIVITGGSSGIGLAAAQQLAAQGAALILVSRDPVRGRAARDLVAQVAAGPEPVFMAADLSSQRAIRSLVDGLHERFDRIDVLLNNAGTASRYRELTVDGLEKTFATNHLGPFLLTHLLLDLLLASPEGRIITTTSESHSRRLDFDNLQAQRHYSFFSAYGRSKLANILFTYELARRLLGTGVTANCFTPGPTSTNFGRGAGGLMGIMSGFVHVIGHSADRSAETAVYLATSPDMSGVSGKYFAHGRPSRSKSITYDRDVAGRLWAISEALTHVNASTGPQPITNHALLEGVR